jgi:hypothetical protein
MSRVLSGSRVEDRALLLPRIWAGATDPASEEERITGAEKATRPREEPRDERAYDGKPASSQFRAGEKPSSAPVAIGPVIIVVAPRTVLVPAIVMAAIPAMVAAWPVAVEAVMAMASAPAMGLRLRVRACADAGKGEAGGKR